MRNRALAVVEAHYPLLMLAQVRALRACAREHGLTWKPELWKEWLRASAEPLLASLPFQKSRTMPASARLPAMNLALRQPMTMAEFLDWEERQELRHEFDGFLPVAMTGGSRAHDAIQVNVVIALGTRLRGGPCRVNGSNLRIEVMGSIRYPDAYVTCGPIRLDGMFAPDPVVIFEVLSKGTARTDRIVKNHEYASTLSVRRYVMLEQAQVAGTMFERVGDDWVGHLLGPVSILAMPEIGIEVPIAEFYEGLDLANASGDEAD